MRPGAIEVAATMMTASCLVAYKITEALFRTAEGSEGKKRECQTLDGVGRSKRLRRRFHVSLGSRPFRFVPYTSARARCSCLSRSFYLCLSFPLSSLDAHLFIDGCTCMRDVCRLRCTFVLCASIRPALGGCTRRKLLSPGR